MLLLDPKLLDEKPSCLATRPRSEQAYDELLRRAEFLLSRDQAILHACFRHHLSVRQISKIIAHAPGWVSRRIQRLLARLRSPLTTLLIDPHCRLPDDCRQLAIEHFVQGQSVRDLANQHQMSPHAVRRTL